MIISFAWTTAALLSGKKTVTRRCWTDNYAAKFIPGSIHQAWSKSPHRGGKHVADIRIISVRRESLALFSDDDYAERELLAEGGLWANTDEFVTLFPCGDPYRVEFRLVNTPATDTNS